MRRFLYVLTFVLIACLTSTVEARKLALLVGVDEYVNVKSLECCVNDMNALKEALMKIGFEEDDIQMLVTGGSYKNFPIKKNIEKSISQIVMKAQPSDMVFLAFSGHGAQDGKNVYFCPPDVEIEDLRGTCVSINKVMDDLANKCKAKFKWMVVDACRNDPTGGPKGIGGKGLQVIPTPPAGIALFQSCAEGEESWEDRDSGNGYFTKNFAAALSGEADANHDGKLTLLEVFAWTTAHTKEQVKHNQNKSQRPYFSGSFSDFTLSEDLNVPKAKKLVEEARKAVEDENYELAVKKYDEAIALCPRYNSIKRERNTANKMLKMSQNTRVVERPASAPSPVQTPTGTPKAGERQVKTVNGVEFAFRWCPPGTFKMGSPTTEEGRSRFIDETQHQVTLTKGFWIMETEVTVGMFKAFVSETGYVSKGNMPCGYVNDSWKQDPQFSWRNPGFSQTDTHPVTNVSWDDAKAFCNWLSKKTGQKITLPTEAQWEYACRAGTTGAYAGNLDEMAWYWDNCNKTTHPVGTKKSNAWGLFDMHGNVWEWCADCEADYPSGSVTDPTGPSSDSSRILRGGSLIDMPSLCRSAIRNSSVPVCRFYSIGFRVVRGQ